MYTTDQRQKLERVHTEMLGNMRFAAPSTSRQEIDELEREIGIPRPSWFTAELPTESDVVKTQLEMRRSR